MAKTKLLNTKVMVVLSLILLYSGLSSAQTPVDTVKVATVKVDTVKADTVKAGSVKADTLKKEKIFIGHGLGIAGGTTSAYGLSYRFFIERFGIFLTYAPIQTKEYNEKVTKHNFGYGLLINLIKGQKAIFFFYQSNYYYQATYYYLQYPDNTYEKIYTENYTNRGLGLGIEFIIAKVVGFNVMGGYGAYKDFETINLTIEGGLYYKF